MLKKVKQFSKSYVFLSALYVAVGIVLLAWPSLSVRMIGNGLGIVMLVLGATYGVIYFTGDRQEGFLQLDLVIGIVCLAFGVFILLTPGFLSMVLPFATAVILFLGAIVKIQSSVSMKRLQFERWYLLLICALVIIALGILLLCNLFRTDSQMLSYIGVCLILDGVTNLVSLTCIQLRSKKLSRLQKRYPNMDLGELLEKDRAERAAKQKKGAPEEVYATARDTTEAQAGCDPAETPWSLPEKFPEAENPQAENSPTENLQTGNLQTENSQTGNPQTENSQTGNPQAEVLRTDASQRGEEGAGRSEFEQTQDGPQKEQENT